MTSSALRSRADALAAEGNWSALREVLRVEDPDSLAADPALAYRFGEALYHTGRMDELDSYAEVYEEVARHTADPGGMQRALNLAGIAAFELGQTSRAQDKFDRLMELAEAEGDEEMLARAANNLGAIANLRGRRHEALAYYHLALALYQKLGQARGLAQTHHNLGLSHRDLGQLDDSVASYIQAAALAESLRYRPLQAMAMVGRAEVELLRGDVTWARELVERGLELAREVPDPVSEAEGLRVRGLTRLEGSQEEQEEAREELAAALRLAREVENALIEAEVLRDLGRLEGRLGDAGSTRRHLEEAVAVFERLGAVAEARGLREELESVG